MIKPKNQFNYKCSIMNHFKKYNGGVETSPVDKEKKYKYDIAGNFQTNRDFLDAINITEISG